MNKKPSDTLRSKRFWSGLIGLIAILITGVAPDLNDHIDTIVPSIVAIVGVLIGGYTIQDTFGSPQPAVPDTVMGEGGGELSAEVA